MKSVKLLFSAAAVAAFVGTASAQLPGLGAAAPDPTAVLNGVAPPPPLAPGIAPQAALPGGPTIWSKLGISQDQREYCRRKTCSTPAGQLMSRIVAPMSTLTGGIIPSYCPTLPSILQLKDPGAIGAASKVKMDRAGAEERVKAVKYLASVDCHYWPEAEETLIAALRADRNECVRYEAAVAFMNGCCCTCKVVMALSITVSCSSQDGHPSEKSARVRAVAAHALDRCLSCVCCAPDLPPLVPPKVDEQKEKDAEKQLIEPGKGDKKDKKETDGKDDKSKVYKHGDAEFPKQYYASVSQVPRQQVVAIGRRAMAIGMQIGYNFNDSINATDYAAAGLPTANEIQTVGKPTTLVELMSWRDSGAAIGQPVLAPPTVVHTASVLTMVAPAPSAPAPNFTLNDPIPKSVPNTKTQMFATPAPAPVPALLTVSQPKPVTVVKPEVISFNAPIAPSVPTPIVKSVPMPVVVPTPIPVAATPKVAPTPVSATALAVKWAPAPSTPSSTGTGQLESDAMPTPKVTTPTSDPVKITKPILAPVTVATPLTPVMPKVVEVMMPKEISTPKPVVTVPSIPVVTPVSNPVPAPVVPIVVPDVSPKPLSMGRTSRPATERGAPQAPVSTDVLAVPSTPTAPVVKPLLKMPPEPAPLNGGYFPSSR